MKWYAAYEKVLPYSVKLDSETGFGTGFLFAYNKNKEIAAIATAAHVIDDVDEWLKPLRITHYQSKKKILLTSKDRAIWINRKQDTATIIVDASALPFPATTLPLLKPDKYTKIGVGVGWAGFPVIASESFCFFSGPISFFLEKEAAYLIDGVAINGVSGGPVFRIPPNADSEHIVQLIGIVSAYRANRRATDTLPGLLVAQDITAVHEHLQKINNMDEAKEIEKKQKEKIENNPKSTESSVEPTKPNGKKV